MEVLSIMLTYWTIGVVNSGTMNHPFQIQYSSMCIYVEKIKTGTPKYIFTLEMIV